MPDNTENRTIIVDLDFNFDDAIRQLGQYQDSIDRVNQKNKELRDSLRQETITRQDYNRQVAENRLEINRQREAMRMLERDTQANIRSQGQYSDSVRGLRTRLSDLRREFDALSASERNAARGQELAQSIRDISSELNEALVSTNRFQQNVGDYEGAITRAITGNNSYIQSLIGIASGSDSASGSTAGLGTNLRGIPGIANLAGTAISGVGAAVGNLTRVLLANPIILVITAVVAILAALRNALNSSEEQTARFTAILAPLRRILDALLSVFQFLVGVILDVVEGIGSLLFGLARLAENIPIVGRYIKAANDELQRSVELEQERYALEIRARQQMVQNARDARDVAELRANAQDRENFTAEQRLEFIQKANAIEKRNADEQLAIQRERLRIAEEEASRAENNAETERELAELRASTYNAELTYFNRIRQLLSQEKTIRSEIASEEKTRREEAQKSFEERQKMLREQMATELALRRQLDDALLNLERDSIDLRIRQAQTESQRVIEDLRARLQTEQNLTQDAINSINDLILTEELRLQNNLYEIRQNGITEEINQERERIRMRLELVRSESTDALNLRIQDIELQRQQAVIAAEQRGEDTLLINQYYDQLVANQRIDNEKQIQQRLLEEEKNALQIRINQAKLDGESELAVRLENKRLEIEALTQLEGESDTAYLQRRQLLNQEIISLERQLASEVVALQERQTEAIENLFGSLSDFLGEFGEQNEAFAAFSKALALFELLINTSRAISAGIAASAGVPFPGNLAAIATTVSTVLANIAQARQLLSQSQEPKANFAQGGLVVGPGTGTSDSIRANLSNGESVMTAKATSLFAPILSAFNQIGGGVPIQAVNASSQINADEMMARYLDAAIKKLPNPVVSVEEINRVNNRVNSLSVETVS